jgi:hypothetical protein
MPQPETLLVHVYNNMPGTYQIETVEANAKYGHPCILARCWPFVSKLQQIYWVRNHLLIKYQTIKLN